MVATRRRLFREAFARRLSRALDQMGAPKHGSGRVEFLAELAGVSMASAQKWLSAHTLPELHRLDDLCFKMGCSIVELFSDEASPIKTARGLPFLYELTFIEGVDEDGKLLQRKILVESDDRRSPYRGLSFFRVSDSLMEPFLMSGDLAVLNLEMIDPEANSIMLIKYGAHLMVRRVQVTLQGDTLLIPENSKYSSETVPPGHDGKSIEFVGAVVGRVLFGH